MFKVGQEYTHKHFIDVTFFVRKVSRKFIFIGPYVLSIFWLNNSKNIIGDDVVVVKSLKGYRNVAEN